MEERKENDDDGTVETLKMLMNAASIEPPRLEDAGLENCALPLESIMEAFSIAAASRFNDTDEEEDDGEDDDQGQNSRITNEKDLGVKEDELNGNSVSSSSSSSTSV